MSARPSTLSDEKRIGLEAAHWIVRCDTGLSPTERGELAQWLEADSRHRQQFDRHERSWRQFGQFAASPSAKSAWLRDQARSRRRAWARLTTVPALAASVAIALAIWHPWKSALPRADASAMARVASRSYQLRMLEDGSIVELNAGAVVDAQFGPNERRVRLVRGEASFSVAKNPLRPFIVHAGDVSVRAIGTVFDVSYSPTKVEVLVTEGRVWMNSASLHIPMVSAGQQAVVSRLPTGPRARVVDVSAMDIKRQLAWQSKLVEFASTPLEEVVAQFNRFNRTQLVIADPQLRRLPIVAEFRLDNVEGFVRLLQFTVGVRAEYHGDQIILRRD